jgi:DNA-binding CsgD family transcriptional regulator
VPAGGRLIERDAELAEVDEAIAAALTGDGRAIVIEGPAGIGKTALLEEAARRAADHGMTVISAQGAALERDFGFGAVRQLFEPVIARADAGLRNRLLAGAAALAGPVVAPDADQAPTQQSAVMHGLYWLTANLAALGALFIVVDDVHWCDVATLQFLVYLARRLEGMAVTLVVAVRTGDPEADTPMMAELLAAPAAHVVRPPPLTAAGVSELIDARLGPPDPRFVDACLQATGGIPFLVGELLRVLSADGVKPTEAAAARIAETGPGTVAHATMLRLSHLPASAASVARAVAVLDRHARLDRVATLAGVDVGEARGAVDALAGMELVVPTQPLRFSHPLVRQAVYDDMSVVARAGAHDRVATQLMVEGAPVEEVAAHLLLTDPAGRPDVVGTLRAAAAGMLARSAPTSAVAYLRRALGEGALRGAERAGLLHELGRAEAFARDPQALDHLTAARDLTDDPVARARIGWELAEFLLFSGEWTAAQALLRDVLAELDGRDPGLQARIEGARAAADAYDPTQTADFDARLERLRALVDRGGPDARMLALVLAVMAVCRGGDRRDVSTLIERGLDGGGLLRDEGSESLALVQGVCALVMIDDLAGAEAACAGVFDDARERGSVLGYVSGCFYRTFIDDQRGRLRVAETYFRSAIERSLEIGVPFALPSVIWAGKDVLLERSSVADIAAMIESIELEPAFLETINGAWVLMVRGRLRIMDGRREEGIADLRMGGDVSDRARLVNPTAVLWRSPLALALVPDDREEARRLVADELDIARQLALPRCEGTALRAAGVIEGGSAGIELLQESLRVFDGVDAPLERARTLVELGAALRRGNQRAAAREPLTAGLELAHVCGAERLAARAVEELHASGARPRRQRVSGPDALTSAEARVARMAADGMTNKEIAQALFVTAKTVENQLGVVYRKLEVRSRDQLGGALSSELSG